MLSFSIPLDLQRNTIFLNDLLLRNSQRNSVSLGVLKVT